MSKKTNYILWFIAGGLYLLGAILPLAPSYRDIGQRSVCLILGAFFIAVGMNYKRDTKNLSPEY
jgi:hypothetical protein